MSSATRGLTSDIIRDHDPYMSPDGAEVAFLRQVSCNRWGIFKVSTTASFPVTSATTVIDDGAINALPAWSRDSSTIYFHRLPVPNWERDAYSRNANGTDKTAAQHRDALQCRRPERDGGERLGVCSPAGAGPAPYRARAARREPPTRRAARGVAVSPG